MGRAGNTVREVRGSPADRHSGGSEYSGAGQHHAQHGRPPHVRTEAFRISVQGRLTTAAGVGASAAMLLHFKKEIIKVARRADKAIINVVASETWTELKILVPYIQYRDESGLAELRDRIEAENEGMVVPPFSMRWIRSKRIIDQYYQEGRLPQDAASVVFKVCSKAVGKKLLTEMWVAGIKFRAIPYIADRADTQCSRCSQWGHSEFRCHQGGAPICAIYARPHCTQEHICEVVTYSRQGKICPHTAMKCPNCGGNHPAHDGRCKAKGVAIEIARGWRAATPRLEQKKERQTRELFHPSCVAGDLPAADCIEDKMDTEMEPSGTTPPVAE